MTLHFQKFQLFIAPKLFEIIHPCSWCWIEVELPARNCLSIRRESSTKQPDHKPRSAASLLPPGRCSAGRALQYLFYSTKRGF